MSKKKERRRFKNFYEDQNEKMNTKKVKPYKRKNRNFKNYLDEYLKEEDEE